ncbi:MAG: CoF synthetase [Maritimibacter sp.]
MTSITRALRSYLFTSWHTRRLQNVETFRAWQAQQLDHWLTHDVPKVDFYAAVPKSLDDLPIIDKTIVMNDFAAFNTGRITAEEGWEAFKGKARQDGVTIGASTGTSGNRALYAITDQERMDWLGSILAKALPGFWYRRERVAIILPQNSALYDGANQTRLMKLKFFDLHAGVETWADELDGFSPTTIVAPPRVLRHLAERASSIRPKRMFAGGETLDPVDQHIIEAYFDRPLGQIYMATEGLFAVSCAHGKMHLTEDANYFEFEPVGEGLVSPIITSFRRSFQIMARYRMNDLLRLSADPCPCGSPLRAVDEVVGRMDDAFEFGDRLVTPDVMRNAVLDAAREITDFRLVRSDENTLELQLPEDTSGAVAALAQGALEGTLGARGLRPEIRVMRAPIAFSSDRKLRRVENHWPRGENRPQPSL